MNITNWFKPKIKLVSGVLPDIRLPEEKQKDYKTEEILVSAAPLNWKPYADWKREPENIKMFNDIEVHSQGNVGSCAAQALALTLAIKNYQEDGIFNKVSAKSIYANRRNKPNAGMFMDDLGKIGVNLGGIFESLYPSPNDTEANMSNLDNYISAFQSMAKVLRMKNYFWLYDTSNIDSFAQVLSMDETITFCVLFGDDDGWNSFSPKVSNNVLKYGHAFDGIPKGVVQHQGKKSIVFQDSHGEGYGDGGRKILTEDWFLKGRILPSIWFEDMNNLAVFNSDIVKPKYVFANDLYFGMRNDEVKVLQKCLATEQDSEGYLFPVYQTFTNYFGSITLQAVKRFQRKYEIEPVLGYCGIKTRSKLNELFNI